jgi:hypothetical protein
MEQSHSWESNSPSAIEQIPSVMSTRKFHYCIHKTVRLLSLSRALLKPLHVDRPCLRSLQETIRVQGPVQHLVTNGFFFCEESLVPRPTPKPEDHPFLAVWGSLLNIFAVALHIWSLPLV